MPASQEALAARLRAARAFSGKKSKNLAVELNVSETTLSRMENGRAQIDETMVNKIVRSTGVPPRFMSEGFANLEALTLPEWAQGLQDQISELDRRLSDLSHEAGERALEDAELPPQSAGTDVPEDDDRDGLEGPDGG